MTIGRLVLLASSLLLASCGTTRLSSEDASGIDAGRKVIVGTYNQPLLGAILLAEQPVTQIISVDGKQLASEVFRGDERVVVDVGSHRIEFRCVSRSGEDERDFSRVMELTLKPYHEYRVRCAFDSRFGPDGTYVGDFSVKERSTR